MKDYQTLNLYQENNLLIDEEAVRLAARAADYGNLYGVEGAGLIDLPTLEDIDISDNATVADVAKAVEDMLYYMDTAGCRCCEVLDVEDFDVVYCHKLKKFMAVSEMDTYPVYMYRNENALETVWLSEPVATVTVEEAPDLTITEGAICTEVYPIDGDPNGFLLRRWSQEAQPSGFIISSDEMTKVIESARDCAGKEKK